MCRSIQSRAIFTAPTHRLALHLGLQLLPEPLLLLQGLPRVLLLRLELVHHNHLVQQPRHGLGLLLVEGLEGGAHDLCAMQRGVVWRE